MPEEQPTPENIAGEHARVASDIDRLRNIATELDEIGQPFTVARWAARTEANPGQLLGQLDQLLASFNEGLMKHFAREEEYLPSLAQSLDAPAVVESLLAEHRHMKSMLHDICDRVHTLALSQATEESMRVELREVTQKLRDLVGLLQGHADKEDELLFITRHNT